MPGHDIIVIGASAGGVEALVKVVKALPRDVPAAFFIVLHIPADSPSLLPDILSRSGHLPAIHPEDGMRIDYGTIYVAPPDNHMMIEYDKIRVVRGPRENRHRPAVDPLFRSAALAYGSRVIGVILTGGMDDGTAGLLAVKRNGGIAMVQDPQKALYPGMPGSALAHVEVDFVLPLSDIGSQLAQLVRLPAIEKGNARMSDDDLLREASVVEDESDATLMRSNERVGEPSAFSCPECGGVLWEVNDGELLRFRCRVGHAYSIDSVIAAQTEEVERALWVALKILEEQAALSNRLAKQARQQSHELLAHSFEQRVHDAEQQAAIIQRVLRHGNGNRSLEKLG